MSYDIDFKVKVEDTNEFISLPENTDANITWNVGTIIRLSTGLEWRNEEDNGLCVDIMPMIAKGLYELESHPEKYKQYESPNGWGTINGTKNFFIWLLNDWQKVSKEYENFVNKIHFWIV